MCRVPLLRFALLFLETLIVEDELATHLEALLDAQLLEREGTYPRYLIVELLVLRVKLRRCGAVWRHVELPQAPVYPTPDERMDDRSPLTQVFLNLIRRVHCVSAPSILCLQFCLPLVSVHNFHVIGGAGNVRKFACRTQNHCGSNEYCEKAMNGVKKR